jgi:hypothetical protein
MRKLVAVARATGDCYEERRRTHRPRILGNVIENAAAAVFSNALLSIHVL